MPAHADIRAASVALAAALERLPGWEAMPPSRFERDGGWMALARDCRGGLGSIAVAAPTEAAALLELARVLEARAAEGGRG